MSSNADPMPSCPYCQGIVIRKMGFSQLRDGHRLPSYRCGSCGRYFNRLSATPLAYRPNREYLWELIKWLPRSVSCAEAARELHVLEAPLRRTVKQLRRWLLVLDPSGCYEQGVQLVGRFTAAQDMPAPGSDDRTEHANEDVSLTDVLLADFDAIHSPHTLPLPVKCPSCDHSRIRLHTCCGTYPEFECQMCGKRFGRRTGTPFSRNRYPERQRFLIRYLGLPLPIIQLSEMIDTDTGITARFIEELRRRCMQLDPSGRLAERIQAGVRPTARTVCIQCGARRLRFDELSGKCANCGRMMSMRREVVERGGCLEVGPLQWIDWSEASGGEGR